MTDLMNLREQLQELTSRRLLAREHVEAAVVEIQRVLREALDGERLRLHNLQVRRDAPYRGVVLRGKFPDRRFDDDHACQVVLRDDGLLVVAWLDERDEIVDRALRQDDLDAEDMPLLVERVLYALQHHTTRVDAMTRRYSEISVLAQRISDALARRIPA